MYKSSYLFTYLICQSLSIENIWGCSVLFFSHPRSKGWPHHGHTFSINLCPVILIDFSKWSPVHILMLSIQAVSGLLRLRAPGIVPCTISFSRQLPCYRLKEPIMKILYGQKNSLRAFGYNSAKSEPVWMKSGIMWAKCWGLALSILGMIRAVATVWDGAKILFFFVTRITHDFTDFPLEKSVLHLNTTTSIGEEVNQVLRFQAVITPQWLQIARNSRPNWPSMGCLVSIFKVKINAVFSLSCMLCTREVPIQMFGNVRCLILHIKTNSTWPSEQYIEEKQTELETENK